MPYSPFVAFNPSSWTRTSISLTLTRCNTTQLELASEPLHNISSSYSFSLSMWPVTHDLPIEKGIAARSSSGR
ncbi:hypothetical protein RJT34_02614 [Clitoria ternatea]|uniref:Uncharacterized protein n=1 Tax=Clitoria ternatea TaxID=43366 RepID=A0AAN9Q111_CLITE